MEGFLERNRLLRAVLDALPLPVFVIDREIRVVDRNAAGAKFLGDAGAGLPSAPPATSCTVSSRSLPRGGAARALPARTASCAA